jgi:hypothetical protein
VRTSSTNVGGEQEHREPCEILHQSLKCSTQKKSYEVPIAMLLDDDVQRGDREARGAPRVSRKRSRRRDNVASTQAATIADPPP